LEKTFALLDRMGEKEAWAAKRKKATAEFVTLLRKADRVELFRLNPAPVGKQSKSAKRNFRGYAILAAAEARSREDRQEVASFVGGLLHWNDLRLALCFNPRHGARITCGKRTLDFLICLECFHVRIYEGDALIDEFNLSPAKTNPMERVLREAEKIRPERP
jgi:hypothetical protein